MDLPARGVINFAVAVLLAFRRCVVVVTSIEEFFFLNCAAINVVKKMFCFSSRWGRNCYHGPSPAPLPPDCHSRHATERLEILAHIIPRPRLRL